MLAAALAGQRFGRLTAIRDVGSVKNGNGKLRVWQCMCACGTLINKRSSQLLQGRARSCGCLRSEVARAKVLLPPGVSGFRGLLRTYRASAKRKEVPFTLSEAEFRQLTTSDCHYCGAPPAQISKIPKGETVFIHNGIDRYDNGRGYTRANSVPCCSDCNYFKGNRSGDQFLSKIYAISKHVKET